MATLPAIGQDGRNIERVAVVRLETGKETILKLSASDILIREGWQPTQVKNAQKGTVLMNIHGNEMYVVTSVDRNKLRVVKLEKNGEPGELTGEIHLEPRNVKAHEYFYQVNDSVGYKKKIKIYDLAFKDRSPETSELIDDLISALPSQFLDCVSEIRIEREAQDRAGVARSEGSLFAKKEILILYVDSDIVSKQELLETFYHELGHNIAKSITGSIHPGPKWRKAMEEDGTTMSGYASERRYKDLNDHGEVEDIAEAARFYFASDGSRDEKYKQILEACASRFNLLEKAGVYLQKNRGLVQSLKNTLRNEKPF